MIPILRQNMIAVGTRKMLIQHCIIRLDLLNSFVASLKVLKKDCLEKENIQRGIFGFILKKIRL